VSCQPPAADDAAGAVARTGACREAGRGHQVRNLSGPARPVARILSFGPGLA
jgi:hypothetical protein